MLIIGLPQAIRSRNYQLYITHIQSHTGLLGLLAHRNEEIDELLIENMLEASKFHEKHHINGKGLKKKISITWQQAKEIS